MDQIPKRITRALRQLAGEAHEEELRRALLPLADAFHRWQRGELGSGELTALIHQFHQGPARELWARYTSGMPGEVVARAIAIGMLERTKIEREVLDLLAHAIQFYESEKGA